MLTNTSWTATWTWFCYTGQVITWETALNSKENLSPPANDWNIELPEPPARPGVTRFA